MPRKHKNQTTKKPKRAIACPHGHTEGLQVRGVVDAPPKLVDGTIEPNLTDLGLVEGVSVDGEPGVDSGVWCPTCEEWYWEADCVHDVDDAGNAIIPTLGDVCMGSDGA